VSTLSYDVVDSLNNTSLTRVPRSNCGGRTSSEEPSQRPIQRCRRCCSGKRHRSCRSMPASFSGKARYMHWLFQDTMATVHRYGKPHQFVTFTCNVQWPEIQSSLFEGQTANDRPDIVCWMFCLKLLDTIDVIAKKEIFGTVLAYVQIIEFRTWASTHAHAVYFDWQTTLLAVSRPFCLRWTARSCRTTATVRDRHQLYAARRVRSS